MRLQELLKEVACRGIVFELAGGGERLKIVAPKGTITDEIRQALGRYNETILSMMRYGLAGGCTCCKGSRFWVSVYAVVICATCHPPANRFLVAEWIEFPYLNRYAVLRETTANYRKTLSNLVSKLKWNSGV